MFIEEQSGIIKEPNETTWISNSTQIQELHIVNIQFDLSSGGKNHFASIAVEHCFVWWAAVLKGRNFDGWLKQWKSKLYLIIVIIAGIVPTADTQIGLNQTGPCAVHPFGHLPDLLIPNPCMLAEDLFS